MAVREVKIWKKDDFISENDMMNIEQRVLSHGSNPLILHSDNDGQYLDKTAQEIIDGAADRIVLIKYTEEENYSMIRFNFLRSIETLVNKDTNQIYGYNFEFNLARFSAETLQDYPHILWQ